MLDPAEVVGDVPIFRPSIARNILAPLDVPVVYRLPAATYVRPDRGTGNSAADSSNVPAASAANLMSENAADDSADNRARNVGPAAILDHLLPLDPATLLRRTDDRVHGTDGHLVNLFIGALSIVVCLRCDWRRRGVVARVAVDRPHRGNASVHTHPRERFIPSGVQNHAATRELRVLAHLPASAVNDRGRSAIVESEALEIPNCFVGSKTATPKSFAFIKSDLRCSLGGENNRCHTQERLQRRLHDHLRIVVSLQYETEFERINSSAQRPSWLSAICDEMCRTDADKVRAIASTYSVFGNSSRAK